MVLRRKLIDKEFIENNRARNTIDSSVLATFVVKVPIRK